MEQRPYRIGINDDFIRRHTVQKFSRVREIRLYSTHGSLILALVPLMISQVGVMLGHAD